MRGAEVDEEAEEIEKEKEKRAKCVELLLGANAAVNQPDSSGDTPLHSAARTGQVACVELLLRANADVNLTDKNGCTPLSIAVQENQNNCAELLMPQSEGLAQPSPA